MIPELAVQGCFHCCHSGFLVETLIVTVSHLFADEETSCHGQSVSEVVDAVGQQVQVSTGL